MTTTRFPRRPTCLAYYRGRPVIIWQTALSRLRRSVEVDRA